MKLANVITLFRVLAVPLIVYFVIQGTAFSSQLALIILFLAVLSDIIDSLMPRKSDKVGSFFDPFADKVLVIGLLLALTIVGSFPWFIFAFFLIRDITIGVLRWLSGHEDVHIKEIYGKFFVATQYVILLAWLFRDFIFLNNLQFELLLPFTKIAIIFFTGLALIIAVLSIVHYIVGYQRALQESKRKRRTIIDQLIILANKRSRGYYDGYRRRLLKIFAKRRKASVTFLPAKRNMFQGSSKKIGKIKNVIIAGGDGSFEGALNYKPLWKKRLGFFPLGAGNSFYSYFYKGKRFEYLRSRFHFKEEEIDVLEMECDSGKVQTILLAAGIDAEVINSSSERTQHGLVDYVKGSWKVLISSNVSFDFQCKVDDKTYHWENCVNISLGKVPYYGFGIRCLLGKVHPRDGNVYALACVNTHSKIFNKPLRLWALLTTTLGFNRSPLLPLKGKKFEISSEKEFPIHAGGEYLGKTKRLRVKVIRKQKLLVI